MYASIASVMVPIWLIFKRSALQAFLPFAISIRFLFVASRSSPTRGIGQSLLNCVHASQSSCAKGSSSKTIGYLSISPWYSFIISDFDFISSFSDEELFPCALKPML